jgi:hypothetical protein
MRGREASSALRKRSSKGRLATPPQRFKKRGLGSFGAIGGQQGLLMVPPRGRSRDPRGRLSFSTKSEKSVRLGYGVKSAAGRAQLVRTQLVSASRMACRT